MRRRLYDTPAWEQARARAILRDGSRCSVGRLIGGDCHSTLHVHHVKAIAEGGAPFDVDNLITVCATHHPSLEALRRRIVAEAPRCTHYHPYRQGREECERRLRQRHLTAA
jgi:hypothetical protein